MRRLLTLALCAAAAFAEDPPASEIPGILDQIRKGSPSDCVEALKKLTPGKEERAAGPIATRLRDESDAQARAALKEALAAYKGGILVRALKAALEGKGVTDDFRTTALELLGPVKDPGAIEIVAKMAFESEFKAMREAARATLIAYGDDGVKQAAVYVRSTNQATAKEAVAALKAINTEKAASPLVGCLVVGSQKELLRIAGVTEVTRDEAVTALKEMGDTAVPALLSGLDSLNHQKWCSYVLQQISGEFHTMKEKGAWVDWWKRRLAEKAGK